MNSNVSGTCDYCVMQCSALSPHAVITGATSGLGLAFADEVGGGRAVCCVCTCVYVCLHVCVVYITFWTAHMFHEDFCAAGVDISHCNQISQLKVRMFTYVCTFGQLHVQLSPSDLIL